MFPCCRSVTPWQEASTVLFMWGIFGSSKMLPPNEEQSVFSKACEDLGCTHLQIFSNKGLWFLGSYHAAIFPNRCVLEQLCQIALKPASPEACIFLLLNGV